MDVFGLSGQKYQLEDKPSLGSGGEGGVYSILGVADKVVKIYHSGVATPELEEKLKLMSGNPPSASILNQVAWPIDVIYDGNRNFRGFVMPRLSITAELGKVYCYPPETNITYKQRIIIAQNICVVISEVHRAGYVFGDFNPRNIGVDTNTGLVAFLDTDTYHIVVDKNSNKAYRCKVCAPGYAAPELLEKCINHKTNHPEDSTDLYAKTPLDTFTEETDNFALAIHMFRLLMNGFTPFGGIKENETASVGSPGTGDMAVIQDNYCFKPGLKPQSAAVPMLDQIPQEIADLFTRAFMYGRIDPKQRPDAIEWYHALERYENTLKQCSKNPAHLYMNSLTSCPWCEADDRFAKAIAPRIKQTKFSNPIIPNKPYSSGQTASTGIGVSGSSANTGAVGSGYTRPIPQQQTPTPKGNLKMWIIVGAVLLVFVILLKSCFDNGSNNNYYSNYDDSDDYYESTANYNVLDIPPITKNVIDVPNASIRTESGKLSKNGQTDTYYFTPKRKGVYRLEFSDIRDEGYVGMEVYDPNGEEIDYSYSGNGYGLTLKNLKADKKYKIKVSYGNKSTPYTLSICKQKKTVDITNATLVNDSHEFTDQDNVYKLVAPYDGTYSFEMAEIMAEGYVGMTAYNRLGEEIDYTYCGNGYGLTLKNLKQGDTYYLHISQGKGYSSYAIKVCCQKEVHDISEYDVVNDSIEFKDQDNIYKYTPSSSGDCYITFSEMTNDAYIGLTVYNRLREEIYDYTYIKNGKKQTLSNLVEGETYEIHVKYSDCITPYSFLIK